MMATGEGYLLVKIENEWKHDIYVEYGCLELNLEPNEADYSAEDMEHIQDPPVVAFCRSSAEEP